MTGIDSRRLPAAVGEDFPVAVDSLGVDGHDNALTSEAFGSFTDEFRAKDRSCVDRNLVGAGFEQVAYVLDPVDASSDRQRHENLVRGAGYDVEDYLPVLVGGGDIEEAEFVRALTIVNAGNFDRVACILQLEKAHALDDAARFDVKARDDSFGEHGQFDDYSKLATISRREQLRAESGRLYPNAILAARLRLINRLLLKPTLDLSI
jgi:hypothetical protein